MQKNITKYETFTSEVVANRMENMFGDSETIERICREKPSLAKRILERIKALIDSLGKSSSERQEIKKLRETERLFRSALETGGQDYIRGEMENFSKAIDGDEDSGYNKIQRSRQAKYISWNKLGIQVKTYIYAELEKLYQGIKNGVADEIAIVNGRTVYIVDSGKENGKIEAAVREKIVIQNTELRNEYKRRVNNESVSKGHCSNGLSARVAPGYDNNRSSNLRRKSGKELSADQGESADNESRIPSDNGDRGGIKRSRKISDTEYLSAVESGDMETAQRMVDEAARAAGYTDKLYHGTRQFGFTEFDPAFSDDKISIFVAGSDELAQTYSGRYGTRKVSEAYKVEGLSIDEIVTRLNEEATESYEDSELKTEYSIMHQADIKELHSEVDSGIERLQELVEGKIKEYAEKMALDFNDSDAKTHKRLFEFKEDLEYYRYDQLSTPLYMLINHTAAFKGESGIEELEYKIRLRNKLSNCDTREGVVIKKDLDGYGLSILYFDEARELLKRRHSEGNYALYGNPRNQLVIDGRGQNWNDIRHWADAVHLTKDGTTVERRGEYFRLFDNKTGNEIFHGRLAVNMYSESLSLAERHSFMLQKANNALDVRAEYMHTTRDIARFAKDNGYESVKFENILDNGGNGKSVGAGDVYAYFEPNNLKSADPVTYDDAGNVIPLSRRFDSNKRDIRRSGKVGEPVTSINDEKMQDSDGDGYSEYDKPIILHDVEVLRSIGRKSINDFTSEDIKKAQKWAYKFYKELGVKSPFFRAWFGDWRAFDKNKVTLVIDDKNAAISSGNAVNRDIGRKLSWNKDVAKESILNAPKIYKGDIAVIAANISQIVENAILFDSFVSEDSSNRKLEGSSWMHSLYSVVKHDNKFSLIKLFAEEVYSEKQNLSFTRAYTLKYITKVAEFDNGVHSNQGGLTGSPSTTINSISDLFEIVKNFDEKFKPKSVNEYLIDKETGLPKVFYHGTRAEFDEFILQDKARFGRALGNGFYFTPDYDKAHKFANGLFSNGQDRGGIIMPVYLRMEKPYVIEKDADRTKWQNEYNKGEYDGIIDLKSQTWYVEDPTQIKSATDNIGTFDRGSKKIRYSRKTDVDRLEPSVNLPLLNRSRFKIYTKENAEIKVCIERKIVKANGFPLAFLFIYYFFFPIRKNISPVICSPLR